MNALPVTTVARFGEKKCLKNVENNIIVMVNRDVTVKQIPIIIITYR